MKMDEKQKKTGITAGLVLLSLGLLFAATAQSGDDGYELSVDTLPPEEVQSTEANFTANVTGLADEYDAALVYWNYSKDSSLDKKGPANIAFQEGEKVESLESSLDPDANYNVEAYVEPIVWSDKKLSNNFLNISKDRNLFSDPEASSKIFSDPEISSLALSSSFVFSDPESSSVFWNQSLEPKPPEKFTSPEEGYVQTSLVQSSYTGGKVLEFDQQDGSGGGSDGPFVYHSLDLDLTGKERLNISVLRTDECSYDEFKITINGDTVFTDQSCHGWQNNSIDVSTYSGSKEIRMGQQIGRFRQRSPTTRVTNIILN
jgi:hypothetical protein